MNRQETLRIMAVLQAAYPMFYAKKSKDELDGIVGLWEEMFSDEPYQVVAMAVKALIKTRVSTFPPGIGEINERILQITQPEEMTEMEAWSLVRRAIRGASMDPSSRLFRNGAMDNRTSAERNFEALPPILQKVVNSPEQLAAWEQLPETQIDTVLQSNFMRSYTAKARYARGYIALPETVKRYMAILEEGMKMERIGSGTGA